MATPHEVFQKTLEATGDRVAAIRNIRERFGLDLRQAKAVMLQAEGIATTLDEREEQIAGTLIQEMNPHCCEDMYREATRVCEKHPDRHDCPDCLIDYSSNFREYGLMIHDGGTATSHIQFCPWCGAQLPESLRNEWFAEMERRGIDPWKDEIPGEFRSAAWWQLRMTPPQDDGEAGEPEGDN